MDDPKIAIKGSEVIISNLPITIKEDEIYNHFSKYGEIIDLRCLTENYETMTTSVNLRFRTLESVSSLLETEEEIIYIVLLIIFKRF